MFDRRLRVCVALHDLGGGEAPGNDLTVSRGLNDGQRALGLRHRLRSEGAFGHPAANEEVRFVLGERCCYLHQIVQHSNEGAGRDPMRGRGSFHISRAEHLRQHPPESPRHTKTYGYRADAESVRSVLDLDGCHERRMIAYTVERQNLIMLDSPSLRTPANAGSALSNRSAYQWPSEASGQAPWAPRAIPHAHEQHRCPWPQSCSDRLHPSVSLAPISGSSTTRMGWREDVDGFRPPIHPVPGP